MPVYFAQIVAENGPIKIGHSGCVIGRCNYIQIWMPWELRLLAAAKGSTRAEAFVQQRFAHLHIRGEWFRPGADLLEFISRCKSAGVVLDLPEILPPGPRRGIRGRRWTHGFWSPTEAA